MEEPCCSNDDHMPGLRREEFKKKMEEDIYQATLLEKILHPLSIVFTGL
jgi:hypothetical protein